MWNTLAWPPVSRPGLRRRPAVHVADADDEDDRREHQRQQGQDLDDAAPPRAAAGAHAARDDEVQQGEGVRRGVEVVSSVPTTARRSSDDTTSTGANRPCAHVDLPDPEAPTSTTSAGSGSGRSSLMTRSLAAGGSARGPRAAGDQGDDHGAGQPDQQLLWHPTRGLALDPPVHRLARRGERRKPRDGWLACAVRRRGAPAIRPAPGAPGARLAAVATAMTPEPDQAVGHRDVQQVTDRAGSCPVRQRAPARGARRRPPRTRAARWRPRARGVPGEHVAGDQHGAP